MIDPENEGSVIQHTEDSAVSILLRVAKVVLTDAEWNAWVLLDVRRHRYEEAAEILGMAEGTVEVVIKARHKLQRAMRNDPRFGGCLPVGQTTRGKGETKPSEGLTGKGEEGTRDGGENIEPDDRSEEQTEQGRPAMRIELTGKEQKRLERAIAIVRNPSDYDVRAFQAGELDTMVHNLLAEAMRDDERLAERLAFDKLWSTVDKQVYGFCCRFLKDGVKAEDAHQETKIAAFQHLKRFDPARGVKFSTWVFRIAFHKCCKSNPTLKVKGSFVWDDRLGWWHKLDQDAAPGRMPTRSIEDEGAPEIADSESLNLFADLETQDQVDAIVATAERVLTPPEFAAWVLRDVDNLPEHEAAIKLNRDPGSIKSWTSRARHKIKAAMEQKFEFSAWSLINFKRLPSGVQNRLTEEVAFGVESIGELWVDRPLGGVERTSDRARIVQHASAKARVKVRHARRAIENKPQFRAWVLVEVVGFSLEEVSTIVIRPQPTVEEWVSQARIKVKRTDVSRSFKGGKRNSK